jgi:hypothetical protein
MLSKYDSPSVCCSKKYCSESNSLFKLTDLVLFYECLIMSLHDKLRAYITLPP